MMHWCSTGSPRSRLSIICAILAPMAFEGWWTVVNRMSPLEAAGESSNPTTAISPGTLRPRSHGAVKEGRGLDCRQPEPMPSGARVRSSSDRIQLLDRVGRQLQRGTGHVLVQVCKR